MKIALAQAPLLDAGESVQVCLLCDEVVLDAWLQSLAAERGEDLDDERVVVALTQEIYRDYLKGSGRPPPAPEGAALFEIRALTYRESIRCDREASKAWEVPRVDGEPSRDQIVQAGLWVAEVEYQRLKAALLGSSGLADALADGPAPAEALHPERGFIYPLDKRSEIRAELSTHIERLTELGPLGKARFAPPSG